MKLSVNRNILWCDVFVQRLNELGAMYACISPGSRSTPITISLVSNKKVKVFPIVDERSSSFFALGLAKKINSPVIIVTTSGTAVAEIYPAIIEAYYSRIPLIVCTGDRPSHLMNRGANQTINQQNIYGNHIRFFADPGLPDLNNIKNIVTLAEKAIEISCYTDRGPVHINLQFEKPFEPKSYTDSIKIAEIQNFFHLGSQEITPLHQSKLTTSELSNKFLAINNGVIIIGYDKYGKNSGEVLTRFAKVLGYPVYIDGASPLRSGIHSNENIIEDMTTIVRAKNFLPKFDPELIIQFGSAPTSNSLLEFFKLSKSDKILVNEFGDKNDPSLSAETIIPCNPEDFCRSILNALPANFHRENPWLDKFKKMNSVISGLKRKLITNASFPFEGRIITEIFNHLPDNSNLMISNSLPIRDTDYFAFSENKKINIYANRGASGIDGIISTAIGIAATSSNPTYLLIGDLAFFHDSNGLHNTIKFNIPLTIILINNSGGGIFHSLPISQYKDILKENFLTPLKIDFKKIVEANGGRIVEIKSWNMFRRKLLYCRKSKSLTILEIKTDAVKSKRQRLLFWNRAAKEVEKYIDEIKS